MQRTPLSLKVVERDNAADLRPYFGEVAHDLVRLLWRGAWLIGVCVVASVGIGMAIVMLMGPRYTSEALIAPNFGHGTGVSNAAAGAPISVDAANLVDSAARIINSRATADAIVTKLRLDLQPQFVHQSLLAHLVSALRPLFGLDSVATSSHDLAVDAVMQAVNVTVEPRAYVISITARSARPEVAARLANAVAAEYVRGQLLREATDRWLATQADLARIVPVYGTHHPAYIQAFDRVEELKARVIELQRQPAAAEEFAPLGLAYSFVPANEVTAPSGPSVVPIILSSLLVGLGFGVWLAQRLLLGSGGNA
jgi:capsular polysaccharide biosynthesis protein